MEMSATAIRLVKQIQRLCIERGLTVAAAESLTTGRVQALLGSQSGSSGFFVGGVCTYNIAMKNRILKVPIGVAKPVNCVSPDVAVAMADHVRRLFDASLGVATTGYAEPAPEHGYPNPGAFIAVSDGARPTAVSNYISIPVADIIATRADVQQYIAERTLDLVLSCL